MAHNRSKGPGRRRKADGPRGRAMSRATWARLDRRKERITRREGRAEARAGREDA